MTRIASAAANAQLVRIILQTQARLQNSQIQVSTEAVSQDYKGLARESERLIGLETTRDVLKRHVQNNDTAALRLNIASDAVDVVKETISQFRRDLSNFAQTANQDEEHIAALQASAFRSMKALEAYLNTEVDGTYLFSGTRNSTEPVNFGISDLDGFQTLYDGSAVTYPTTRDTHLNLRLTGTTGLPTDPDNQGFGDITFADANPDTITAATAGAFANLPVGAQITISGANAGGNNGTFTIAANDGTTITLSGTDALVADANDAGATIVADTSYYHGDTNPVVHRVDPRQEFENTINAANPAFEKAIRAMGIIAQGVFNTAGGLDQNLTRVTEAKFLIDSALFSTAEGVPPFGVEEKDSIESVGVAIGFNQVLLDRTTTNSKHTIGLLDLRVGAIENIDMLEAITRVTDDSRSLEASYQTIARIRSLNLQDFLR